MQGLFRERAAYGVCRVAFDASRHSLWTGDGDLVAVHCHGSARKSGLGNHGAATPPDFAVGWGIGPAFDRSLRCDAVSHCVAGHVVGTEMPPVDISGVSSIVPSIAVAVVISVSETVTIAVPVAVPEAMLGVAPAPRRPRIPADVTA